MVIVLQDTLAGKPSVVLCDLSVTDSQTLPQALQ